MKNVIYLGLFIATLGMTSLSADDPVCKKCQLIREYNAKNPQKQYADYRDYLKDNGLNADLTPLEGMQCTDGSCQMEISQPI